MRFRSIEFVDKGFDGKNFGYKIDGDFRLFDASPGKVVDWLMRIPLIGGIFRSVFGYMEISARNLPPQTVFFVKKSCFYEKLTDWTRNSYTRYGQYHGICSDDVIQRVINTLMTEQAKKEKKKDFTPSYDFFRDCTDAFEKEMFNVRMASVKEVIGEEYNPLEARQLELSSGNNGINFYDLPKRIDAATFLNNESCLWGELFDGHLFVATKDKAGKVSFVYEQQLGIWK